MIVNARRKSRNARRRLRLNRRSRQRQLESLEERLPLAFQAVLSGAAPDFVLTLTDDADSSQVEFSVDASLNFQHNLATLGVPGFESDIDLDSNSPGVNSVPFDQVRDVIIRGGDGDDVVSIQFDTRLPILPGIDFFGEGGNDTVQGPDLESSWALFGDNNGILTSASLLFFDVESVRGGADIDHFNSAGGTLSGGIDGGLGNDEIVANNVPNTFRITAADSGEHVGVTSFVGIENLIGNADDDQFVFVGDGALSGMAVADGNLDTNIDSAVVTANTQTVTTDVVVGDVLVFDHSALPGASYTVDGTTVAQNGVDLTANATGFESIRLFTSELESSTVQVVDTFGDSRVEITTGQDDDTVDVVTTGDRSLLRISTQGGDDRVRFSNTGEQSVTLIETGDGLDAVNRFDVGFSSTTGINSGVSVQTGANDDVVNINASGDTSALFVATGDGDDALRMDSSGSFSFIELQGDDGIDVFDVLGLVENSELLVVGGANNDSVNVRLSELEGTLVVDGGANDSTPVTEATITAKNESRSLELAAGDQVLIDDRLETVAVAYRLNENAVERDGVAHLMYSNVETVDLRTTLATADVTVDSTAAMSIVAITTADAEDRIEVVTTGDGSALQIETNGADDTIDVQNSGDGSLLIADSGDGDDRVNSDPAILSHGTGANSLLSLRTGDGSDIVMLEALGESSTSRVDLGADDDQAFISTLGPNAVLQVDGSLGNDSVRVESMNVDSAAQINGEEGLDVVDIPSIELLAGTLMIDGGQNLGGAAFVSTITAKGKSQSLSLETGDILRIADSGAATAAEVAYGLTAATVSLDGRDVVIYDAVESVSLATRLQSPASVVVEDTPDLSDVSITTGPFVDRILVAATGTQSRLTVDSLADADELTLEQIGDESLVFLDAGIGADQVTTGTGLSLGSENGLSVELGEGEDNALIVNTGLDSVVVVDGGGEDDELTVVAVGATTHVEVQGAAGNDLLRVQQSDIDSQVLLSGGENNDEISITEFAQILGNVMVDGGNADETPVSDSVTAKLKTMTWAGVSGDRLTVNDQLSNVDTSYELDVDTIAHNGVDRIMYAEIETLQLLTTENAQANLDVTSTSVDTSIVTGLVDDDIDVVTTGLTTRLVVDSRGGNDSVDLLSTGDSSLTRVTLGDGEDRFNQDALGGGQTTGASSGLEVLGGFAADAIRLVDSGSDAVASLNGENGDDTITIDNVGTVTSVAATGEGGADQFTLAASRADSEALLDGGEENDTFELSPLAEIQGTVMIDGGGNEEQPTISTSVTAKATTSSLDLAVGDEVTFDDTLATQANLSYQLDSDSLRRDGQDVVMFTSLETVNLSTSADQTADVEILATNPSVTTRVQTGSRDDSLVVDSTGQRSVLRATLGRGDDLVQIFGVGQESISVVATEAGADFVRTPTAAALGERSGLHVIAGEDSDVVELNTTGVESVSLVEMGAGIDVAEIHGSGGRSTLQVDGDGADDVLTVTSTGLDSQIQWNGGDGNDSLGLPRFDGIEGTIMVDGGDEGVSITSTLSVTSQGETMQSSVSLGDEIVMSDNMLGTPTSYVLDATTVARNNVERVMFSDVESIRLVTTLGVADVEVANTPAASLVDVVGGPAADRFTVTTTGESGQLRMASGDGNDTIDVARIGNRSIAHIEGDAGADALSLLDTGDTSAVMLSGNAGNDAIQVSAVEANSLVRVEGGAGNDSVTVVGATPSLETISGILGRLHVDGSGNDPAALEPMRVNGTVMDAETGAIQNGDWNGHSMFMADVEQRETGDTLRLIDRDFGTAATYEVATVTNLLTDRSGAVRRINGPGIVFEATETVHLETGSRDDVVEVFISPRADALPQQIQIDGNGGTNRLDVVGTARQDIVLVGDLGAAVASPIELEQIQRLNVYANAGDDIVFNDTGRTDISNVAKSLVDGGLGNDIIAGGPGLDVVFGGRGRDAVFGAEGSDFLFGDVDLQGNIIPEAGDVVFGNLGKRNDPGEVDEAVVLVPPGPGVDFVDEVEILLEEGAIKGVWSWLTATFPDLSLVSLGNGRFRSPQIEAMRQRALTQLGDNATTGGQQTLVQPTLDQPVILGTSVTDLSPAGSVSATSVLDVDRNGMVAPFDALLVINRLNSTSEGEPSLDDVRYDVSGDGAITSFDVLLIVNALNAQQQVRSLAAMPAHPVSIQPASNNAVSAITTTAMPATVALPNWMLAAAVDDQLDGTDEE